MKRNPEHALEAIEAFQTWQTVAELTDEERSTVVAALSLLRQVVESVSQRTPMSTREIVREIVDQCRVDGIIQLDRLLEACQQMKPSAYGSQTRGEKYTLGRIIDEISEFGSEALAQLDISQAVRNVLHRSSIHTISQLRLRLGQTNGLKIREMGKARRNQVDAALLKFDLSRERHSDPELGGGSSEG